MALTDVLSGGLLDTSAPNYAKLASKSEKSRQGIIRLGLDQINAVYGGGTVPFYSPANTGDNKFSGKNSYYKLSNGAFTPYWAPKGKTSQTGVGMALASGGGDLFASTAIKTLGIDKLVNGLFGSSQSPRDLAKKAFRRGQLFNAPEYQTFEGFQEPFFKKRAEDYVNFALPQLAQQYQQTRNAMQFGLANRGLGGSTVESQARSGLEREAGVGRQNIADTGIAQANQLRRDIEDSRQQSVQQLYQSADPAQALQGAIRSAIEFQAPSVLAPISNMFTNLAQQYATSQLLNNYRQPYSMTDTSGYDFSGAIPNP